MLDGQSNTVARDYHNERLGDRERNPFVRSFGSSVRNEGVVNDTRFNIANADAANTSGAIGQWGMRLEDIVVVSDAGAIRCSTTDHDLIAVNA